MHHLHLSLLSALHLIFFSFFQEKQFFFSYSFSPHLATFLSHIFSFPLIPLQPQHHSLKPLNCKESQGYHQGQNSYIFTFQGAARDADKVFLAAIDKFDAMMSKSNNYAPDGMLKLLFSILEPSLYGGFIQQLLIHALLCLSFKEPLKCVVK